MGCGLWGALFLIVIGVWIWASNYGFRFSFYRDWPVLFVIIGFFALLRILKRRR
ncbi:MAG: DUF5668 domain-containing protein [candidate division WOR-3 bacterium]